VSERQKEEFFQPGGGQLFRGDRRLQHQNRTTTSFFFTRFPVGTLESDLWKVFARFGNVGEVFVPHKLDKWGRSFGFVRFRDVTDVEVMERKLEEKWVGESRLKVNRARFEREGQQVMEVSKQGVGSSGALVQQGRSFSNVLSTVQVPPEKQKLQRPCMVVAPSKDRLEELESCYVGVLSYFREAIQVQHSLVLEGLNQIRVSLMGDDLVLIQSKIPREIERARAKNEAWWKATFKEVKRWSSSRVAKNLWSPFTCVG